MLLLPRAALGYDIHEEPLGETGDRLVLVEDHRVPLVTVVVMLPAGNLSQHWHRRQCEYAWELQPSFVKGKLDYHAVSLATVLQLDTYDWQSVLRAEFFKEDLEQGLDIVRKLFSNRRKEAVLALDDAMQHHWQELEKSPRFVLERTAARLVAKRGDPRRALYERPMPIERTTAFWEKRRDLLLRLPGRMVGFAGDLTPEEAREAAAGLLPELRRRKPADPDGQLAPLLPAGERKPERELRMPGLSQVFLGLVRDGPSLGDPDYPAFMVADHVLAGHSYARLAQALRHEGGDVYTVFSMGGQQAAPSPYLIRTQTSLARAQAVEELALATLRELQAQGISAEERQAALMALKGRALRQEQAPDQVLLAHMFELEEGVPRATSAVHRQRAAELSLEEINGYIERFFDPAAFSIVRVVPEAR